MESGRDREPYSRLCIHTQTNRPWSLSRCVEHYAGAGVAGISVWRHHLEQIPPEKAGKLIAESGLQAVSLVRGGFFASVEPARRKNAVAENLQAIRDAAMLGSGLLVLVCGADPLQSQEESREQIRAGIEQILPEAEKSGVRLAIEPLHPMYAADRSAITTMRQANDLAGSVGSPFLGVAVDVFHLWWDPGLEDEIRRCGRMDKLFAFHICDWKPAMSHMLNDRGLMGEGCIRLREIRGWMEQAGFDGFMEVEVFSDHYWAMDQADYLRQIMQSYTTYML